MTEAERFPFVQLELAGSIGLADGRYLAHAEGDRAEHVLVVRTRDPVPLPRRRFRASRPRAVEPDAGDPTPPLTTLTIVRPDSLGERAAANGWLAKLRADPEAVEAEVRSALVQLNRAVHAHRAAALDPNVADVAADHALAVRVGYGTGDGLVDGRWEEAIAPPQEPRPGRGEVLRPQERVAAVLGGHERVGACEALLLRARADLDAERTREATFQLRVGLEALLSELGGESASFAAADASAKQAADLATLAERKRITGEAANEALAGELAAERAAEVEETVRICERVLRRRRAFGGPGS